MIMGQDQDQIETKEWTDSIANVIEYDSQERAAFLIDAVLKQYEKLTGHRLAQPINTDYVNSIKWTDQVPYPGNKDIEKRISAYIRWNATAIVLRANKESSELAGHIASYASSADLYEVGFNHFWRAAQKDNPGDIVFFQGHSSPGIYARSLLEERFSDEKADNFRQEAAKVGLSSYPHPWLMPDYWQVPTVSMGLGPLMAIYQARFMHYLQDRGMISTQDRKIWCFIGDGETSEPETLGNINIAGREKLDNLIFVINCNLQRLDGPVCGNGKIIQELEGIFTGANWKVIKVIWGHGWDRLLDKDKSGKLKQLMMETIDGDYQDIRSKDGAYLRTKFFGKYKETLALVSDMTDEELWDLTRGGHDLEKIHAAYYEAINNAESKPVCLLMKTVKGFGMKGEGESQNIAHQQKKLSSETLKHIRDKFNIPLTDEQIEKTPYLKLEVGTPEYNYLHENRKKLGGFYPVRQPTSATLPVLELQAYDVLLKGTGEREMSTTMAFVRMLNVMVKDKALGKHIVPIVPDESRTFGMEGMFRQLGIWSHIGQLYTPEDAGQLMFYKEAQSGQIFQEGINEPGAMSTWIAAATSYANHYLPMLPFYIYYSMFGFQRVGDLAWAAGDSRARGFLIGGTAGRTTLSGEGLQHADGHSHIQAGLIPNCESYDPTFAYELAVIIQHGMKEMYSENKDKFYYLTVMNEKYTHPEMPAGIENDIIKGAYIFKSVGTGKLCVNLMGSGTIFREAIAAADLLAQDFGLKVTLISATSYNRLAREARVRDRYNLLHPTSTQQKPFIAELLEKTGAKVTVSATDYIRSYAEQIRGHVPGVYTVLGTDGFGRSDYRKTLREFFEVNRYYIAIAALKGLADSGILEQNIVANAISKYEIDPLKANPWEV